MATPQTPFSEATVDEILAGARTEAVANSEEVVRAYQELIALLSRVHGRARISRDVEELRQAARYLAIADEHLQGLLAALRREIDNE